ncbi:MAG: zinc-dependent metalloprotease, partial [Gemmatimonadetes bacterium]|nr:zinc-dependent metalloprotease [Gemmatimonadota bacterium]
PLPLLGREMVLQSRIAKTAGGVGYGGGQSDFSVVAWERLGDRILLRRMNYENVAYESEPISRAVESSNFEPILAAFDIEALSPDSGAVVVEVSDLFTSDVPLLGLRKSQRESYGVRRLDADRTFLLWTKSFPLNVEVRRVLTYEATDPPTDSPTNTISLEMNHSMVLLPEEPMQPRLWDERVGFFSVQQTDFGLDNQKAETRRYITRWRLEPSDTAAFLRGELVDPVKPIVYYIDPATPEKWRSYLKQGIEDWQVAFEAAGFSNAIIAKDPPSPEEDPEFSPEDARYSVIRYLASTVQNASGPHIHDPRSGEILESDIQWYHNVMNLVRNWYFVQTAAANPQARGVEFDDEVMGELIRFVSSHEVGHTLGLPHNMKSSAMWPVDSLRTDFVCRNGTATTIMDYARFNYVAQPGDDTCYNPKIGPYDLYNIEWGYRPILDADSPEEELPTLREWIIAKADDPTYRFGGGSRTDPTDLSEALGDDAMRASDFGVENLKLTVANLRDWAGEYGKDYSQIAELYNAILGQWNLYVGHVVTNIGGVVWTRRDQSQSGPPYIPVPEATQRRAMDYLDRQVFQTPNWMLDRDLLYRIQDSGSQDRIQQLQAGAVNRVLDVDRMKRLIEDEAFRGDMAYSLGEMLEALRESIWAELRTGGEIDPYRRNLQRAYVARVGAVMTDEAAVPTDIVPFLRGELEAVKRRIQTGIMLRGAPTATRLHLQDVVRRIDEIL